MTTQAVRPPAPPVLDVDPVRRERRPARGNRSWRVETPTGPVLLKLYQERRGVVSRWVSRVATALIGTKTSPSAAARHDTEALLLQHWRAAGVAVPELLTDRHPHLGDERTQVLEFVAAPTLGERLIELRGRRDERDALLRRFGAELAWRYRLAIDHQDVQLAHEHGAVDHVFVQGDRFVWYDLERGYRPRAAVVPRVARELLGLLRSMRKLATPPVFRADVRALVEGFDDDALLRRLAEHYLSGWVWTLDRRLRERRRDRRGWGKYEGLDCLVAVLDERA